MLRAISRALLVLALACGAAGCVSFIDEAKMARLKQTGVPAEATVMSLEQLGIIVNRTYHLLRLELDVPVQGPEGVVLTRIFANYYVSHLAIPSVQPKAKIPVRYDPASPSDVYIDFEAMGFR